MKRALVLLVLAYVLNFFKFIVPLAAGGIPPQLLEDFGIPAGQAGAWQLLLLGDILQLAAISLVVLALVQRLPYYHYWAIVLAAVVLLVSPFLWNIQSPQPVVNYLFDLLWGYNARVYFPVFPWLVYPLVGMAAGHYLLTASGFFVKARNAGIIMMAGGWAISAIDPARHWGDFYRTAQGGTLYHAGFVLFWLYICHLAVRFIPPNRFFTLLTMLSRNITRIYMVQWILVFWLIALIGYRQLGIVPSLICITGITWLVMMIGLRRSNH